MNVNVDRSQKTHVVTFRLHGELVSLEIPKGKTSRKEVRKAIIEYASLDSRKWGLAPKDSAPPVEE